MQRCCAGALLTCITTGECVCTSPSATILFSGYILTGLAEKCKRFLRPSHGKRMKITNLCRARRTVGAYCQSFFFVIGGIIATGRRGQRPRCSAVPQRDGDNQNTRRPRAGTLFAKEGRGYVGATAPVARCCALHKFVFSCVGHVCFHRYHCTYRFQRV